MKQLLRSRRWLWAIVAVAVIAGLVFGGIALAGASKPTSLNPETLSVKPTPTPWPSPLPTPPNQNQPSYVMTAAEVEEWLQKMLEENRNNGGFDIITVGPTTKGCNIAVAGKVIKLPDDAYVEARADCILCIAGFTCPQTPFYTIARGNSRLEVDYSGKIWSEEIAQGDEGAFDFIKEALR